MTPNQAQGYAADRSDKFYPKMYWMTSENKVPIWSNKPGSLSHEVRQCFSSVTGSRLDFNADTYNFLQHNCNKYTSEALRFLDLPKFNSESDKGFFDPIAFSATREESSSRNFFGIESRFGVEPAPISHECRRAGFWKAEANCRRNGYFSPNSGDCPGLVELRGWMELPDDTEAEVEKKESTSYFARFFGGGTYKPPRPKRAYVHYENQKPDIRCYDMDASKGLWAATVGYVGYQGHVNGKCALRTGAKCIPGFEIPC